MPSMEMIVEVVHLRREATSLIITVLKKQTD